MFDEIEVLPLHDALARMAEWQAVALSMLAKRTPRVSIATCSGCLAQYNICVYVSSVHGDACWCGGSWLDQVTPISWRSSWPAVSRSLSNGKAIDLT